MEEQTSNDAATQELAEAIEIAEQVAIEVKGVRDAFDETLEKVNADQEALRIDLEERAATLFQKEVDYELKSMGLEAFADVINVSDTEQLKAVTAKLQGIVNGIKIEAGYIPKDNAKQDEYTTAKKNGDSRSMIKALFGKR